MKKLALKPGYVLLLAEITFLCGLEPNAPDTVLSGTEKRQLSNIYYKYFGSDEALSKTLMENEGAQKWPGGERKKSHECQRAILSILHRLNVALTTAGPIDTNPTARMDLSFVMSLLKNAKANEILMLTLACEVITEVPVVKKTPMVDFYVSGVRHSNDFGSSITAPFIISLYAQNNEVKEGGVKVFSKLADGEPEEMTEETCIKLTDARYSFEVLQA